MTNRVKAGKRAFSAGKRARVPRKMALVKVGGF